MYETTQNNRTVNKVTFPTWKREITNANILEVEAGTTGYQGGDTGHGGRTYFSLKNLGGTDIDARLIRDKVGDVEGVEISLGGDAELETFKEALRFTLEVLDDQTNTPPTLIHK